MRRVVVALVAVLALAAATVVTFEAVGRSQERAHEQRRADAQRVAAAFAEAWQHGTWDTMRQLTRAPGAEAAHAAVSAALGGNPTRVTAGSVELAGDTARADLHVTWRLDPFGTWRYDTELSLRETPAGWRVAWRPAVLHPQLARGQRLDVAYRWPSRGAILAADGTPLAVGDDTVTVGLRGERVESVAAVRRALTRFTPANPPAVDAAVQEASAQPDEFTPVTELSRTAFERVRARLEPVPGVFFEAHRRLRPQAARLPSTLLGQVGELSAAAARRRGNPYRRRDVAGVSGLEAAYDERLAGGPAAQLRIVDADGTVVEVLRQTRATPPRPVRITIDPDVQSAAEAALGSAPTPAALVAVDAATGSVLAAANAPAYGFDRALRGRYPPGSTFKVVTAATLLAEDVTTPSTPIGCPAATTVGGRTFSNAGGAAYGVIGFREAFFRSCNTAFVQLAAGLTPRQQVVGARRFGFAEEQAEHWMAVGTFPRTADVVEQAAAAIGQGRVTASPAHMATVAAAIASGVWRPPTVVAGDPPPGRPYRLPDADARVLRALMRDVVARGTGTAAQVPGMRIGGKTGTAEYGAGDPPPTHAWFIGFHDAVAVAVLVEGGGFGGEVAAPIAADFFAATRG